jgi:hypothetical protein
MEMAHVATMPDIKEYKTIEEASRDARIPYTAYWIRRLCQTGRIAAIKVEGAARGTWLVHIPSLLEYVQKMDDLGTQKHTPN